MNVVLSPVDRGSTPVADLIHDLTAGAAAHCHRGLGSVERLRDMDAQRCAARDTREHTGGP